MYIIYNPMAGNRNFKKLNAVLDSLAYYGIFPELLRTEYAGHARELAASVANQRDLTIVAAGGDGTVAEVVSGLLGTDARLGIIPMGTANVMAHEFRIPYEPTKIAKVLAQARGRILWPGCLQHSSGKRQIFIQMVSVGFDASVVHHINPSLKRLLGRYAYFIQMLKELSCYQFAPIEIEIDGQIQFSAGAIISKGRFYGGNYLLTKNANSSEPGFTVILFERGGIRSVLRVGWALLTDSVSNLKGVRVVKATEVKLLSPSGVPLQADGDPSGFTSAKISNSKSSIFVATL